MEEFLKLTFLKTFWSSAHRNMPEMRTHASKIWSFQVFLWTPLWCHNQARTGKCSMDWMPTQLFKKFNIKFSLQPFFFTSKFRIRTYFGKKLKDHQRDQWVPKIDLNDAKVVASELGWLQRIDGSTSSSEIFRRRIVGRPLNGTSI